MKLRKANTAHKVSLKDFKMYAQIGRGSYGVVYLVMHRITGKHYAMKTIQKDRVLVKGTTKRVLLELEILTKAQGNYLCGIESFFHTELSLCLVMPFL